MSRLRTFFAVLGLVLYAAAVIAWGAMGEVLHAIK